MIPRNDGWAPSMNILLPALSEGRWKGSWSEVLETRKADGMAHQLAGHTEGIQDGRFGLNLETFLEKVPLIPDTFSTCSPSPPIVFPHAGLV